MFSFEFSNEAGTLAGGDVNSGLNMSLSARPDEATTSDEEEKASRRRAVTTAAARLVCASERFACRGLDADNLRWFDIHLNQRQRGAGRRRRAAVGTTIRSAHMMFSRGCGTRVYRPDL